MRETPAQPQASQRTVVTPSFWFWLQGSQCLRRAWITCRWSSLSRDSRWADWASCASTSGVKRTPIGSIKMGCSMWNDSSGVGDGGDLVDLVVGSGLDEVVGAVAAVVLVEVVSVGDLVEGPVLGGGAVGGVAGVGHGLFEFTRGVGLAEGSWVCFWVVGVGFGALYLAMREAGGRVDQSMGNLWGLTRTP